MNGHIVMCDQGHNICESCYETLLLTPLVRCPECRSTTLGMRNRALETLAATIQVPCPLQCGERVMFSMKRHHIEHTCKRRLVNCACGVKILAGD